MGSLLGKFNLGKNLERMIWEMGVGEEGWTGPEHLELHGQNFSPYLYINEPVSQSYNEEKERTLYIKRTGSGKDDFLVNVNRVKDYIWEKVLIDAGEYAEDIFNREIAILEYEKPISIEDELENALKSEDYELATKLKNKIKNSL